jgi:hypothetical protein
MFKLLTVKRLGCIKSFRKTLVITSKCLIKIGEKTRLSSGRNHRNRTWSENGNVFKLFCARVMKEIISYITRAQKNLKTLPFTEHVGFLWFCPELRLPCLRSRRFLWNFLIMITRVSIDSSHAFVFLKFFMHPNVLWEQRPGSTLT